MAFAKVKSGPVDRGTFRTFQDSLTPEWVEAALAASGTATVRKRRLPAEQVLWLVVGMALFRDLPITEVVRELELALPTQTGQGVVPSAVVQARARLGGVPLRWLLEKTGSAWGHASARQQAWRGLGVYGVDGTTVRVPDSAANRSHFGPVSAGEGGRGLSGYPLVRLVTLMALRSHLLVAADFGPFATGEVTCAQSLWAHVPDDSVTVVDRGFLSAAVLLPLARDGNNRHWLTRAKKDTKWKQVRQLGEGDWLVDMTVSRHAHVTDASLEAGSAWPVRAITYQRRGFRPQTLLTSLLDCEAWPAQDVIALYHERWELELGFDEVKTEMLEREECIRSRKPSGVDQEVWGLLLAYNLVRFEMQHVAHDAGVPPTRISFVAALRFVRLTLLGLVFASPGVIPKRLVCLRQDLQHFVLPLRRSQRLYPRAVKLKMSSYPRKRPTDDPKRYPGSA